MRNEADLVVPHITAFLDLTCAEDSLEKRSSHK